MRDGTKITAFPTAPPSQPTIQQFARTLNRDLNAARNAVTDKWSNGQADGQINRLKTLKRAVWPGKHRTGSSADAALRMETSGKIALSFAPFVRRIS
jgi:hypothetical protein